MKLTGPNVNIDETLPVTYQPALLDIVSTLWIELSLCRQFAGNTTYHVRSLFYDVCNFCLEILS